MRCLDRSCFFSTLRTILWFAALEFHCPKRKIRIEVTVLFVCVWICGVEDVYRMCVWKVICVGHDKPISTKHQMTPETGFF